MVLKGLFASRTVKHLKKLV
ncbi:hypothetical protein E2C01_039648 [Portunus trituberculatus]|uniref:Uncharacterized protein n=1 Tax=Portunus trituberculatus TaxID=210409 RepID=A0A5B7FHD9_PORTR|nr:hypothetical protein [Portunus trituberculatus]